MKTGTSCTRCANASSCPKFDSHTLYGFCRGFEPRRKRKKLRRAYRVLRWLKICGLMLALARVGEFFKNMGQNERRGDGNKILD